ncbi:FGGY-family carbohydrate kinase [Thiopseudomonas alkaliphila]|uniref:FGGY-family carbohydrate kinase n=2 Tax=Thiopseudomonas alkaliphila TaxID=1697053 RepID=UPI00069D2F67|nr:FGGY-family carbohydrate kinase [Thiopseudomonas alkaliphila]AKX50553.1 carbohydrate kinase [Thiopseudomonas alkaliphila]AKX56891.1 carbohydrate kinase [Thiopseudomonas alkaliphila]
MSYLLSIDSGTQSLRAILFDAQGQVHSISRIELEPYYSQQPGWAEQDADYYWQALGQACQQLWRQTSITPEQVQGLSVTTQRGSLVHVDSAGQALRPVMLWLDQRRTAVAQRLSSKWRWLFKLAGATTLVDYFRSQAEVNWVAAEQPEVHAQTHKVLLLSGYFHYHLTGRFTDSVASCVAYLPFDYKKQRWASANDWKWQALPLRPEQLPDLVQPAELIGPLLPAAAAHIGLPAGIPVIAAAADKACEILGSNAVEPHVASLSYGTTATINTTQARYLEVTRLLPAYPAALPQHFTTEVMIYRGFWMVSWFKREFGLQEALRAEQLGVSVESLFDELVQRIPAGSMGLMLQPYWTPGVKEPGAEAKGAIIGFGDVHTRGHIYRAILEGLAYGLRQGKEQIEAKTKVPITEVRVSGGGSQSDMAMQITADVFGLPVQRPATIETSGLGAAICCAVGLGWYSSFSAALAAMTQTGQTFYPNADNHQLYQRLYQQVYKKMYRRLQPLYRSIAKVTGYPQQY